MNMDNETVTKRERKIPVLLVEDDMYISDLYTRKFSGEEFDVRAVFDGAEAWKVLQEETWHPDLLLLDIDMPKMNGEELLKAIRADRRFDHMKAIVLTNEAASERADRMLRAGANGFFEKSRYTPSEVLENVRRTMLA